MTNATQASVFLPAAVSTRSFFDSLTHPAHRIAFAIVVIVMNLGGVTFGGPIHDAVINGDLDTVKALINKDPKLVFCEDTIFLENIITAHGGRVTRNYTLLHYAAEKGHKEIVELLLSKEARANNIAYVQRYVLMLIYSCLCMAMSQGTNQRFKPSIAHH